MNQELYKVEAFGDREAQVWVAESEDIPGLVTEADTIEALTDKLRQMIPELLQANHLISVDAQEAIVFKLINRYKNHQYSMTQPLDNINSSSTQSIKHLTLAELEKFIKNIVRQALQEEKDKLQNQNQQTFLETFGSWQDNRTPEEIINDIYSSRTLGRDENSL